MKVVKERKSRNIDDSVTPGAGWEVLAYAYIKIVSQLLTDTFIPTSKIYNLNRLDQ